MVTVTLKKQTGGTSYIIDAVYVRVFSEVESEKYIPLNNVRNEQIFAVWKKWEIRFAKLNETQLTFLEDLITSTDVQFIYNSVTYTVEVEKVNARPIGGSLVIINRTPES